MKLFDYLNSINFDKNDLFKDSPSDSEYVPFLINRGLSYFSDTVFIANEINKHPTIPKRQQFDFLRLSVTKRKRFSKWAKQDPSTDDLELVQSHYNFSRIRALEALRILTPDQLAQLKENSYRGGNSTNKSV